MDRLTELVKLEESIREAMLGVDWQSRIDLHNLHVKVKTEIRAITNG